MKTAKKVLDIEGTNPEEQVASVYRLELDPDDTNPQHEFVMVSAVNRLGLGLLETMVFPCTNELGMGVEWEQLAETRTFSHADALAVLGFEIA